MSTAGLTDRPDAGAGSGPAPTAPSGAPARGPVDRQRMYRLVLATVWLFDGLLQLQPLMFTPGAGGLSGMLTGRAAGNPSWIAHTITWNGSLVDHQPVLTNAAFASVQLLIAFGIIFPRTCRPALALSVLWSLGVWWFGEGLGSLLSGGATPFGGGPGGVLFYAVLAVLLWPRPGPDRPFVAARTVGVGPAKAIWTVVWLGLALLSVVGSGRSPRALHDLVADVDHGQPGWLAHINRSSESLFSQHGATMAVLLAAVCVIVAVGVFLPPRWTQVTVVLAIAAFALIGVAVQDLGGVLAGGATDPNAAPLVVLLALIYWPLTATRQSAATLGAEPAPVRPGTAPRAEVA